jgi:hypothetical protein
MTMREPPSSSAASSGMGQNPRPASTGPSAAGGGAQSGRPGVPPNQDNAGSGGVRDQIGEQVGPAAEKVQEKAGQAFGQVRQQMTSQLDSQKDKAAEGLTQAADAVRKTTEQLRQQEQMSAVANYAEDAAETIERLAGFLRERDMSQLMSETERFARQRPTMFLASAFTLGLVAARFLKSSPPQANGAGYGSGYGSGQAPYQLSSPSYSPPSPPPAPVTRPPATTATPPTTSNPVTGVGSVSTGPQPQSTQNRPNTGQVPPTSGGV